MRIVLTEVHGIMKDLHDNTTPNQPEDDVEIDPLQS